jgi:hypothetical protein
MLRNSGFPVSASQNRKRFVPIRGFTLPAYLCLLVTLSAFSQTPPADLVQRVDDSEFARETDLPGYTVTERYTVFRNGNSEPAATATVETVYKRGQGKTYTVQSRTGSTFLQKYLIDRVIAEQQGISKGDARRNALITSENYTMQFVREERLEGRDCLVLRLTAKRKTPYLLNGQIWVDSHNYHLVRVKGHPSAMPSIWTGLPEIQRDYQELHGYPLASSSRSQSKRPMIGTTVLQIDYENYRISP